MSPFDYGGFGGGLTSIFQSMMDFSMFLGLEFIRILLYGRFYDDDFRNVWNDFFGHRQIEATNVSDEFFGWKSTT